MGLTPLHYPTKKEREGKIFLCCWNSEEINLMLPPNNMSHLPAGQTWYSSQSKGKKHTNRLKAAKAVDDSNELQTVADDSEH